MLQEFDVIVDEYKPLNRAEFCKILTSMLKDFDFKRVEPFESQQLTFDEWLNSFRKFISF